MKHHILTAIGLFLFCIQLFSQRVTELTDLKDIVFARNLTDWQMNPVDSLLFDIYYPTGATSDKKYPVFFSFHGGSFVTATKQSVTEFADEFADYGYIVIAPDYRVGYDNNNGKATCIVGDDSTGLQGAIYRAMQDANACMRYIANHADLYNIDTSQMFIGGASAGGTLALNMAYINDSVAAVHYPEFVNTWGTLQNTGNSDPYNYTIKGICAMWGALPYWDSLISPKSAISTILFKGGKDANVPDGIGYYLNCPYNSKIRSGSGIYNLLTAYGVPCVYHYQTYAGHAAYDNDFCITNTACFFNGLMNRKPYSGYYQLYDPSCH